jgi:hypothetical protein
MASFGRQMHVCLLHGLMDRDEFLITWFECICILGVLWVLLTNNQITWFECIYRICPRSALGLLVQWSDHLIRMHIPYMS